MYQMKLFEGMARTLSHVQERMAPDGPAAGSHRFNYTKETFGHITPATEKNSNEHRSPCTPCRGFSFTREYAILFKLATLFFAFAMSPQKLSPAK